MLVASLNFEYGTFGTHIFANLISPSIPSIQLTHLPQDGLMKLCDDQSMSFHTTFGTPNKILYLDQ